MIKVLPSAAAHLKLQTGQGRRWRRGAAGLSAPQYPAHRSYTELAPDRFKDFWRDHAVVVRECFDRVVTAQPFAELYGQRSNYQAGFQAMVGKRHSRVWAMSKKISFVDTSGRPVSGHFEVSEGLIIVTLSDGTKTAADIQESMLSRETLARMLLLQMHQTKHSDAKSEDALED